MRPYSTRYGSAGRHDVWCVMFGDRVVSEHDTVLEAATECNRRNDNAEGLHQIGVAVAVWAGMAAAQEPLRDETAIVRRWVEHWRESAGKWKELAFARSKDLAAARMLTRMQWFTIADAEAALAAERAARRKWELRLRARANAAYERFDRLSVRAYNVGHRSKELPVLVLLGSGVRGWPKHNIAGPRGVLP